MSVTKRLSKLFLHAQIIPFDKSSKIVLMSDCHRGDGSWSDSFSNNQNLFFAALTYYYEKNFTYIELGDGDELWENIKLDEIKSDHSDAFWLMSKFYKKGRMYMIYGNHDIVKSRKRFLYQQCNTFYDESIRKNVPLFPDIKIKEGLILENCEQGYRIHLAHGHQGDFINDTHWKIARFLVRYVWKPLKLIGVSDPTSTAKNYEKKDKVEKKLMKWADTEKKMLIAGHTHRPVFPKVGESLYFNDGSCVHPRCITAIEIENESISLIKWSIKTREDRSLFVEKEILVGPEKLSNYFTSSL